MAFAGDYIALGAKGKRNSTRSITSFLVSDPCGLVSGGGGAAKRGDSSSTGASGSSAGASGVPSGAGSLAHKKQQQSRGGGASSSSTSSSGWEGVAADFVDSSDLFRAATDKDATPERTTSLLCGAVRALRIQRSKPDQLLYLSLLLLAKSEPRLFLSSPQDHVLEAFCSLLRRDAKESYKSKGNALVPVLAANILAAAYREERSWPEVFVRIYVEDAMGERLWVDHPDCKGFVDNIVTAFGTK